MMTRSKSSSEQPVSPPVVSSPEPISSSPPSSPEPVLLKNVGSNIKARWVMVTNTKKDGAGNENFIDFAEIYVYDKNNVNVALKKPVSSYTVYGTSNINNFVDGSETTIGHTKNEDEVEWLRIDLGSEIELKKIVIVGRKDCCQWRMKGYKIALYGGNSPPTLSTTPIAISKMNGEISPNNVYAWDVTTSSIEKSVDTKYPPQYIRYSHNYLHY